MKAIIVYDSLYGNTEKIANSIAQGIGGEVKVVKVGEANAAELGTYDLAVIGSPTQGGKHTKLMQEFLRKIPDGTLKNNKVAAFDTRLKNMFVKLFGWGASHIADELIGKGAKLVAPSEGFFVKSAKGPLVEGETERATAWGKAIAAKIK